MSDSEPVAPYAPPRAELLERVGEGGIPSGPHGLPRLGPLLGEALRLFRSRLPTIALIVLVVYLPLDLILEAQPSARGEDFASLAKSLRLWRALEVFFGVISTMALANLVEAERSGTRLTARTCFREALTRWPSSLWTQFLLNSILLVSLVLLVAPAVFVAVATYYAVTVVALRNLSGIAALRASWDLVRGRWWPTCRFLVLLILCQVAASLPAGAAAAFLPESFALSVLISLLGDIVGSFFLVANTLLFLHLEASHEARPITPDQPA